MLTRREFTKGLMTVGAASGLRLPIANAADYHGKLFAFVQATGGWDPTSFCDPKVNLPGEPVINNWAQSQGIRQAGNIPYAPFARNQAFFEKYYQRMLVINGVDAQTNSHTTGVIHNWSGRVAEGYPTTTALLAAHNGSSLAMPYLTFGGFSKTGGLTTFTRLENPDRVTDVVKPEEYAYSESRPYLSTEDWNTLKEFRAAREARNASAPNLLPRAARNRQLYQSSLLPGATEGLRAFADMMQAEQFAENERTDNNRNWSNLKRQAQIAVLAFKARVAVSADLFLRGFDTHADHDEDHGWLLANLTESVDYLWDYAEIHGLADRLVVVMGSDFGRTNKYNADGGKDHWPIGSFVVMEKNQAWTNRVVGETDELHFARKMDPITLRRDDASGTLIHPRHIHQALRHYLGIESSEGSLQFPFRGTENLPLFG